MQCFVVPARFMFNIDLVHQEESTTLRRGGKMMEQSPARGFTFVHFDLRATECQRRREKKNTSIRK
jgi:hypothetical protein